ncbi:hypothetical protein BG20_I0729 [Candidatus Nitrosarchaeum limnium BG20]|uniref:Cation/H+ exchanger domain-containing protein n=1 Tax=Candidatus Nitrosarchaeum limnium BG20 TaxID=859192 RepID=S2E7G4_9ARCH|nr:hypothetical protein [Candidatus Nitrosarchaeum limnium]EPA05406.1 hypothetical protein BG20_I0729 [Candidatus Nitrosarchaeum limnium BG20]
MNNFAQQIDLSGISDGLNQIYSGLLGAVTYTPHTSFITDLAFIMIIGAIATLAFFKIKQPLIIGYLFGGMLLGPLSPLWTWILPAGSNSSDVLASTGILTDVSALNLFSEIRCYFTSFCNWN